MNKDLYDGLIIKPSLDELYHHGVKGQRKGVRHGPPYPLSRQKKGNGRLVSGKGSISKKNKKSVVKVPKKSIQEAKPYNRDSFSKAAKVANSNQDMFNYIMDRAFMDQDRSAIEDFNYEIKRVAKENGIDPDDLETIVNEAYNNREKTKNWMNANSSEDIHKKKSKEPKSRKVWSYAMLDKDLKTGRRELTKEEYDRYTMHIYDQYAKVLPWLNDYVMNNDPNFERFDPLHPQESIQKYRDDLNKKSEESSKKTSKMKKKKGK